jgi:hypothetical protein
MSTVVDLLNNSPLYHPRNAVNVRTQGLARPAGVNDVNRGVRTVLTPLTAMRTVVHTWNPHQKPRSHVNTQIEGIKGGIISDQTRGRSRAWGGEVES